MLTLLLAAPRIKEDASNASWLLSFVDDLGYLYNHSVRGLNVDRRGSNFASQNKWKYDCKYRNRSILYFICSIALALVWCGFLIICGASDLQDNTMVKRALAIFGYVATWFSWVLVGFNLARAKGYLRDFAINARVPLHYRTLFPGGCGCFSAIHFVWTGR